MPRITRARTKRPRTKRPPFVPSALGGDLAKTFDWAVNGMAVQAFERALDPWHDERTARQRDADAASVSLGRVVAGRTSGVTRRRKAATILRAVEAIKKAKAGCSDKQAARVFLARKRVWHTYTDEEQMRKIKNLAQCISNARRKKP